MRRAFTLVEIMIYLGVIALATFGLVAYSVTISQSRAKSTIAADVQAQARFALSIIGEKIRESSGVNSAASIFGSDPGTLSLAMDDPAKNPTVIDLDTDNGRLRIKEGLAASVYLTGQTLSVKNFQFRDLTDGDRENIAIDMTLGYRDSGSVEYLYDYTIRSAYGSRK